MLCVVCKQVKQALLLLQAQTAKNDIVLYIIYCILCLFIVFNLHLQLFNAIWIENVVSILYIIDKIGFDYKNGMETPQQTRKIRLLIWNILVFMDDIWYVFCFFLIVFTCFSLI